MNCENFERQLLQDPTSMDEKSHAHRLGCPRCQQLYEKTVNFEQKLQDVFKGEENQELIDRLNLEFADNRRRQRNKKRFFAVTASLLVLSLAGAGSIELFKQRSIADFLLSHIDHEIEQLNNQVLVSQLTLDAYFKTFNSPYLRVLQEVTYVRKCWLRTGYGLHMVVRGKNGPVTLLLMPDESVGQLMRVSSAQFQGKIYPVREGSLAIVGQPGEPVEMLAETIRMAM